MPNSTNLSLPYIDANQNQKYVTHNTALRILDALVQIQVQSAALTAPPASPGDGQCWIPASGATGAWTGKDAQLAVWQDGAWAFYPPKAGYLAYNLATSTELIFTTSWVALNAAGAPTTVPALGIGTAADNSNPLSVLANAILFNALTAGGGGTGDIRAKISKAAAGNTASFLFQDNFSGRAEIGLTADDNFHFKVSSNGTTFRDAIILDAATGRASFPQSGSFAVQGRLTLTSGTPVLSSTVTAAATVYWTPYGGNSLSLWNGSVFAPVAFAELSNVLANAATGNAGPAAAAANSVYDLFVWSNAGTLALTRGPAWTSGTSRSLALSRVNGIMVNAAAITNGPAAGFGTYVGTIMTDAGGATVTFNRGSAASGGGAAVIGLWNQYNRIAVGGLVADTTGSWTYAVAATWRAANGSATARVTFVTGAAEDFWDATYATTCPAPSTPAGASCAGAVGFNSTTAFSGTTAFNNVTNAFMQSARATAQPIGSNFFSAIEYVSAGTGTFYGTAGAPAEFQSGMTWTGRY